MVYSNSMSLRAGSGRLAAHDIKNGMAHISAHQWMNIGGVVNRELGSATSWLDIDAILAWFALFIIFVWARVIASRRLIAHHQRPSRVLKLSALASASSFAA